MQPLKDPKKMRWNFAIAYFCFVATVVVWAILHPAPRCTGYHDRDGHEWSRCLEDSGFCEEHLSMCRVCLMEGEKPERRDSFYLWMDSILDKHWHQVDSLWVKSPYPGKIDSFDLMYWQPAD